jgi:hypothetical protein
MDGDWIDGFRQSTENPSFFAYISFCVSYSDSGLAPGGRELVPLRNNFETYSQIANSAARRRRDHHEKSGWYWCRPPRAHKRYSRGTIVGRTCVQGFKHHRSWSLLKAL